MSATSDSRGSSWRAIGASGHLQCSITQHSILMPGNAACCQHRRPGSQRGPQTTPCICDSVDRGWSTNHGSTNGCFVHVGAGGARDGKAGEANKGDAATAAREPAEADTHVEGEGTELPRHPMEPPVPCHSYVSRVGRSRPKSVHVRLKEHTNEAVEHGSVGEGGRSCGRDGHGHGLGEGHGCGLRSEGGHRSDDGLEDLAALLQQSAGSCGAAAARL